MAAVARRRAGHARARAGAGKSPLRVASLVRDARPAQAVIPRPTAGAEAVTPRAMRQMMISEFEAWLRSKTNREGRPYQADRGGVRRDRASAEPLDGQPGHRR